MDMSAMTESRYIVQTEQWELMIGCLRGVEGKGAVTENLVSLASALEERSGYPGGALKPTHKCCQCLLLCPVDPLLQIHPEIFMITWCLCSYL